MSPLFLILVCSYGKIGVPGRLWDKTPLHDEESDSGSEGFGASIMPIFNAAVQDEIIRRRELNRHRDNMRALYNAEVAHIRQSQQDKRDQLRQKKIAERANKQARNLRRANDKTPWWWEEALPEGVQDWYDRVIELEKEIAQRKSELNFSVFNQQHAFNDVII